MFVVFGGWGDNMGTKGKGCHSHIVPNDRRRTQEVS